MDHKIEQWLKSKIFKIKMATSDVEIEDLQLLLESNICKLSCEKLEELAEHLELLIATYTGEKQTGYFKACARQNVGWNRVLRNHRNEERIYVWSAKFLSR